MLVAFPTDLPASSLLARLRCNGSYTDCFTLTVPFAATQAQFIEAFYTTQLFKAERLILHLLAGKRSTDEHATEVAAGNRSAFAVWQVTERTASEILLTDETGRTSSWLMTEPNFASTGVSTRLYFGSAIKPRRAPAADGKPQFGRLFYALLGLHNLYSRRLLEAAARKLTATAAQPARGDT
jgi:hypothetical protein